MSGCLVLLLLNECQPDQAGDYHDNISDAKELLKHHQNARQWRDRQNIAKASRRQIGEAEEEELEEGPRLIGIVNAGKAARRQGLTDQIGIGKSPGEQGKGSARGVQLVDGYPVILHHVGYQATRRIEIQY